LTVVYRLPQRRTSLVAQSNIERNLSQHFGNITVRFVWRRSIAQPPTTIEFMDTVRTMLGESQAGFRSKGRRPARRK
jgi:hypothetical protein